MNFLFHNPTAIGNNLITELSKLEPGQQAVIFLPKSFSAHFDKAFQQLLEAKLDFGKLTFAPSFIDVKNNQDNSYLNSASFNQLIAKGIRTHYFQIDSADWLASAQSYNDWTQEVFAGNFVKLGFLECNEIYQLAGILPHDLEDASLFYLDWVVGYEMTNINEGQLITLSFAAIAKLDGVALCARQDDPIWGLQKGKGRADGMAIADKPALFLKNLPQVDVYWEGYTPKS